MLTGSDRYVTLRGGLTLPIAPIWLALELEAKGFRLTADGSDILVSPFSKLTDDDKRSIKLWKMHLLALLAYEPDGVQ